jgi:hypothetical protein
MKTLLDPVGDEATNAGNGPRRRGQELSTFAPA